MLSASKRGRPMHFRSTTRKLLAAGLAVSLACSGVTPSFACTSMVFKAQDGAGIYARTMEWGASDLHSQMVLVPRGTKFSSELAVDKTGMTWKTKYGYVGIIGTGETYKAIVKLTFAKGASLDDPSRLFNSSHEGNTRRAIDIHEGDRIDEKASKAPILAAVALNTSKKSAARANFTRR